MRGWTTSTWAVGAVLALVTVVTPVAAEAGPSCEANAKTTMLSGGFTEAEVEITVRYSAPDCRTAAQVSDVTLHFARCYWNPFVDFTSNEACRTTNKASAPNGIWQQQEGAFSWTDAAGQFTQSGSFWLTATVATDEGDAVYSACDWSGFKPRDAKVHCSGHVKAI